MSSLRAALIALFAASVAMAAVMVALVVSSDHETLQGADGGRSARSSA